MTFPDSPDMVPGSLQGYPPWVSVTRAQDVARLLLLPKDVPTAFKAINEAAVKGLPQEVRRAERGAAAWLLDGLCSSRIGRF